MSNAMTNNQLKILLVLAQDGREKYGLEIIDKMEEMKAGAIALGSLYNAMNSLEKQGYVKGRDGDIEPGRRGRKRYYKITGSGLRVATAISTDISVLARGLAHG